MNNDWNFNWMRVKKVVELSRVSMRSAGACFHRDTQKNLLNRMSFKKVLAVGMFLSKQKTLKENRTMLKQKVF